MISSLSTPTFIGTQISKHFFSGTPSSDLYLQSSPLKMAAPVNSSRSNHSFFTSFSFPTELIPQQSPCPCSPLDFQNCSVLQPHPHPTPESPIIKNFDHSILEKYFPRFPRFRFYPRGKTKTRKWRKTRKTRKVHKIF